MSWWRAPSLKEFIERCEKKYRAEYINGSEPVVLERTERGKTYYVVLPEMPEDDASLEFDMVTSMCRHLQIPQIEFLHQPVDRSKGQHHA